MNRLMSLLLFGLLLCILSVQGLKYEVRLDEAIGKRFEKATEALIAQEGVDQIVKTIQDTLQNSVPSSVYMGLGSLNDLFLNSLSDSAVLEIEGIVQQLESKVAVSDLINLNLIVDLVEFFAQRGGLYEKVQFQNIDLVFTRNGEIVHQDSRPFGYVAEKKGNLLRELIENHNGKDVTLAYLEAVMATFGSPQFIHTKESPRPFHNDSTGKASHCEDNGSQVDCNRHEGSIFTGIWIRSVLWQVPLGNAPANGWPVVLHFQGSFFAPHVFSWNGARWMPFGAYEQTLGIKELLDDGYAVITPESHMNGYTFWDTNIPPYSLLWEIAPDHLFMKAMLREISNSRGMFGHLNNKMKFATGISSGGYMTSRMAVSYRGEFRALAICGGSYATCAGVLCVVPPILPNDHPPTLFLHGALDPIVPLYTMELYDVALTLNGIHTKKFVDLFGFHEWVDGSAIEVLKWFNHYRG